MITFQEDQSYGYRERTIKNASADITLAFAIDFNSAGERLTKSSVPRNKKYFPIDLNNLSNNAKMGRIEYIDRDTSGYKVATINIAGNGLYTMKNWFDQKQCDHYVEDFLHMLFSAPYFKYQTVKLIRSGGQTGFDEAGLKAAVRLGIPALCLAPKGWKFRDINGTDICDEKQFKARFL